MLTSYRYWRVVFSAQNVVAISELAFTWNGQFNFLTPYSVTNNGHILDSGFPLSNVNDGIIETIDGNNSAQVTQAGNAVLDLYVDLSSSQLVTDIHIATRVKTGFPTNINLYGSSDSISWTLVDSWANPTYSIGWWTKLSIHYPVLSGPFSGIVKKGDPFYHKFTAAYASYSGFSGYSFSGVPNGLTYNTATGEISGVSGIVAPLGDYVLSVSATNNTGTDTQTVTFHQVSNTVTEGYVHVISSNLNPAPVGRLLTYIWEFWDGEVRTTTENTIAKVISRGPVLPISITATDDLANAVSTNVQLYANQAPKLVQLTLSNINLTIPYTTVITATVSDFNAGIDVQWLDSSDNVIGTGNPFTYTVNDTSTEIICKLTDTRGSVSLFLVPLFGIQNSKPVISPITVNLPEIPGIDLAYAVDLATTQQIDPMSEIHIDRVTFTGTDNLPNVGPAFNKKLILVKDQTNKVENGIYSVSAWQAVLQYTQGSFDISKALYSNNSITLSFTTRNYTGADTYYRDGLVIGQNIKLKGNDGELTAKINNVTWLSDRVIIGVSNEIISGTILDSEWITVYFSWKRDTTLINNGSLYYVRAGNINGNRIFYAQANPGGQDIIPGTTGIEFIQEVPVPTAFVVGTKLQLEAYVYDVDVNQTLTYTWSFWDGTVLQKTVLAGDRVVALRCGKMITDTYAGLKEINLTVTDSGNPPGTTTARIFINVEG